MANADESASAPPSAVSESAACGFVCVCVQKSVEFNITDHKLHRANKDRELHEELEKLSAVTPSEYAYQLGGGVRVMGHSSKEHPLFIGSWGESVAVFEGVLANLQELARTFPAAGHTVTTATFSSTPEAVPAAPSTPPPTSVSAISAASSDAGGSEVSSANPALVVCLMYEALGQDLLMHLRGKFSFCLYHGKTGRVLAARDGSGAVPLFQGISAAQSLVISSRKAFLGSCEEVKEFEPSYFKYGWYSEPRKFTPGALHNHHHGHQHHQGHHQAGQRRSGSARNSLDISRPSPTQGHGQGQGQVAAAGAPRLGRKSLDCGGSAAPPPQRRGRTSLDLPSGGATGGAGGGQSKGASPAVPPAVPEVEGDGDWNVVGARNNRRKSIDAGPGAGAGPRPDSARQAGRRRSVDHHSAAHAHASGHDDHKAAPKTPPKGLSKQAPAPAPAGEPLRGFKWDVNAPEFKPPTAQA